MTDTDRLLRGGSDNGSALAGRGGGNGGGRGVAPKPRRPARPPAMPPGEDWRRILDAVGRFRWVVLALTVVGTGAGIVVQRFQASTYEAGATVWVEVANRRDREPGPSPVWTGQILGTTGWVDLLQSYLVLEQVASEQRLYLRPKNARATAALSTFTPGEGLQPGTYRLSVSSSDQRVTLSRNGEVVEQGPVGATVGDSVGFRWSPAAEHLTPGTTLEVTVTSPREAANALARALLVETDPAGNFLRLEYRHSDPERIAPTVNAVATRFVAVAAELKREKLAELRRILDEQLDQARREMARAEEALKTFRVTNATELAGAAPVTAARDPVTAGFIDRRVALDQVRRDRAAVERAVAVAAIDSSRAVEALAQIGAAQRSTALSEALTALTERRVELRALEAKYTRDHPALRRLASDLAALERTTVPSLATALATELAERERVLAADVELASRGLRTIPPLLIDEARLVREVGTAEQLLSAIQVRHEGARLAELSSIPDVRVLDFAATPQQPLGRAGGLMIAASFLGSLLLGLVGAVAADRVDHKVRYPEHVTQRLGLPILGALPDADGEDKGAPLIEAFRGIRLNVTRAHGTASPLLLTVTSPGSADGKSFVASNLALAFAHAGSSTLLIDADVRRGALHRPVQGRRRLGLTDVLAGQVGLDAAIQTTAFPHLSFIGGGTRMPSGPELLASPAMEAVVADLRDRYQVVILDTAPLAAGVDPYVLGLLTGSVLLVLRSGATNWELAEVKMDMLEQLRVRVLGAVLNDVRSRGVFKYYSYYLAGYEAVGEPAPRPVLRSVPK